MLSTASSPSRAGCVYALASLAPVSVVLALFLATRKPGSPMTLLVLQLLALPLATGMLGFVTEASAGARKGADAGARAVSRGVRVGVVVAVAWAFILLPLSDLQPGPLLREFEFALSRTLYFDFLVIIPAVAVQGMAGAVAGLLLFKEGERGRTVLRLGIPGAFPQRSPDPPPSAQARARGDSESVVALVLRGVRTFTVSLLVSIPMSVLVSVVWPRAAALLSLLPLALGFLGSAMPLPGEGDEGRRSAINRALAALGCVLPGALLVAGSTAAHTLAPDARWSVPPWESSSRFSYSTRSLAPSSWRDPSNPRCSHFWRSWRCPAHSQSALPGR